VECSANTDYVSGSGTWGSSCQDAFDTATDDCIAAGYDYFNKNSFIYGGGPASVVAAYWSKTGSLEGYIAVPEGDKGTKVGMGVWVSARSSCFIVPTAGSHSCSLSTMQRC